MVQLVPIVFCLYGAVLFFESKGMETSWNFPPSDGCGAVIVAVALTMDIRIVCHGTVSPVYMQRISSLHAVCPGTVPGKRTASGGLWWPRAALWSSGAFPLRLNSGMSLKAYLVCSSLQKEKKRSF